MQKSTQAWATWQAAMEAEQDRQSEAALKAIKAIHAAGPIPVSQLNIPLAEIARGGNARFGADTMKFSPSGRMIGWYRPGQRRGLPSRRTSAERQAHDYLKNLRQTLAYAADGSTQKGRGKLSGQARRENSTAEQLKAHCDQAGIAGKLPRGLAKVLAREFSCDPNYVRRVLSRYLKGRAR